ncbi:MAG: hypothetical protein KDD70_16920, partial [Bdellovibrionales bacterium]|nr:hypothetical protein [Bdellovibrionales bacterium]
MTSNRSYRDIALELLNAHRQKFGQSFERFYRPKILAKTGSPLQKIAAEPLQRVNANQKDGIRDKKFFSQLSENAR